MNTSTHFLTLNFGAAELSSYRQPKIIINLPTKYANF
jgi:hypothetical protein